jgi:hypothetical protein
MRSNRTKGLLTRMLLVVSLLFGFMAFVGTSTAEAQYRHRGRVIVRPRVFVYPRTFYPRTYYPRRYGFTRVYIPPTHVTEEQGFRDGLNDGKDDAEDDKGYRPESHNSFKNARSSAYLDGFRRGYAEGYRQVRGD